MGYDAVRETPSQALSRAASVSRWDCRASSNLSPSLLRRASHFLNGKDSPSVIWCETPPMADVLERSPRISHLGSLTPSRSHSDNTVPSRFSLDSQHAPYASLSSASPSSLHTTDVSIGVAADFGLGEGFDSLGTDLSLAIPLPLQRSSTTFGHARPPIGSALTQALMQASHAECEPGTTADLLSIVLNRDSRLHDFSYIDVRHPCKIWWGTKDDKRKRKA